MATRQDTDAELWDRLFQVTGDVFAFAEELARDGNEVMKVELLKSAMQVGKWLVRANAANGEGAWRKNMREARLQAIETDYWLRMSYVLQQKEDVQRDVSNLVAQYKYIIDLLERVERQKA